MLNVEWRVIEEFPRYQVSRTGEVRNIQTGKLMRFFKQNSGYLVASLVKQTGTRTSKRTVHRLVAEAFHPNPEGKSMVNHKDGNRLNNHADNLEWVTATENCQHAIEKGLKVYNRPTLGKKLKPRGAGLPTPYLGVCWVAKTKRWLVRVQDQGKVVIQKSGFLTDKDAAQYYDSQVKLLKLNRKLNFPEN